MAICQHNESIDEFDKVSARMRQNGEDPARYGWYIDMLRYGVLPSAGFGIGIERLTRYVCGLEAVWEARLFPKVAGIPSP
ncbi:MAG: amino acid--tRNA ligase-related protein [Nitrososphaeria archaeon]